MRLLALAMVVRSLELRRQCVKVRGGETPLDKLPVGVRAHVVGVAALTLVAVSGVVDANAVFGLGPLHQVWRPVTANLYLGTPSMKWATSLYLLVKYGGELEAAVSTPKYVKFVILQMMLLTLCGSIIGLPNVASGLVSAIIYAWARLEPYGDIQFQFGIKLKNYMLPYGLIVVECLQAQSVLAAIPHVLGVLCAHFHHFVSVVLPRIAKDDDSPLTPNKKASLLKPVGRKLGS